MEYDISVGVDGKGVTTRAELKKRNTVCTW